MDKEADVVFSTPEEERTDQTYANYFSIDVFTFLRYDIGNQRLMLTLTTAHQRRNACAPCSGFRANIQLFLSILFLPCYLVDYGGVLCPFQSEDSMVRTCCISS